MKKTFIPFLFCLATVGSHAQEKQPVTLNIGDAAPPLQVAQWIKGTPVGKFEKGKIYVIEGWATWCKPCIAAMPHLSALADKYKDNIIFLGIDVFENRKTPFQKIKKLADSLAHKMNYNVGIQQDALMETAWFKAAGEQGIPKSFVVDADGKLAWIGHPKDIEPVLLKIVNRNWDVKNERAIRDNNKRLAALDDSLNYELMRFRSDPYNRLDQGKPDSALSMINEILKQEPGLKFTYNLARHTFSALLKTDLKAAYEYGKLAIVTPFYGDEPAYEVISGIISVYEGRINFPAGIYELGAEALQKEADAVPYPELANMPKLYMQMAEWYWTAKNKTKAIEAQQKAIEAMKTYP